MNDAGYSITCRDEDYPAEKGNNAKDPKRGDSAHPNLRGRIHDQLRRPITRFRNDEGVARLPRLRYRGKTVPFYQRLVRNADKATGNRRD